MDTEFPQTLIEAVRHFADRQVSFDFMVKLRWPDKINAGQVSNFKWSARDFLPTAAEIAFAKSPPAIDGVSILPTLLGGRLKPAGRVFENKPAPGQ